MELTLIEILEILTTIKGVVDLIPIDEDSTEVIPSELIDMFETLNDGEVGNNDIEVLLSDIRTSLVSEEQQPYLAEVQQRLDIVDQRLNSEFIALNDCLGFMATTLICFVSFKFFNWLFDVVSK